MSEEGSTEETQASPLQEEIQDIGAYLASHGWVTAWNPDGTISLQPPMEFALDPSVAVQALQAPGLAPEVRNALLDQLEVWVKLANFAKWLSIGLAVGSVALVVFMLSAMTWDDLFTGSGMWEFSLVLFALAVFIASPLAIFVVGRPLKGIDEWAPTLSVGTPSSVPRDT